MRFTGADNTAKAPCLVALCISFMFGCSRQPSRLLSAQDPHLPGHGPWFEGWYARVVDQGGERSVAVIVGTYRAASHSEGPIAGDDPGYIGILYHEGTGAPTKSWTFLPNTTRVTLDGGAVTENPDIYSSNDHRFIWSAPGFGTFSNNSVAIDVPGEVAVTMAFGAGKSWDDDSELPLGPEGYLAPLPVPLHWYVKSLASTASYTVQMSEAGRGSYVTGTGRAHLEKNWGQAFPKAWNWLQGLSSTDDAQFVLGGGTVGFGPFDLDAWLAGYRSPKEHWDLRFSDLGTQIDTEQQPCQGRLRVHAARPDLEVEIAAEAPSASFGTVAVPTADGFKKDFGAESFAATITVDTYRWADGVKRLRERRVFKQAALEFGAGSYCPPR